MFFYSNESNEPPHIHVERDDSLAKFWLEPVSLAKSAGFSLRELRIIERMIEEKRDLCLAEWRDFFDES